MGERKLISGLVTGLAERGGQVSACKNKQAGVDGRRYKLHIWSAKH